LSGRIARAARAIAVDAGILRRRRELRLLIVGQSISDLGSMITFVARGQQPAARSAAVGAVRRGALIAACTAIRRPPLDALLPRLVEREELKSASALQWAIHNTASMAGPAIGGVLIATAGAAVTYTADLVTFGVSLAALASMQTPPPPEGQSLGMHAIAEGLCYARSQRCCRAWWPTTRAAARTPTRT
jgi:predicted MFS family arabinose efflux permease